MTDPGQRGGPFLAIKTSVWQTPRRSRPAPFVTTVWAPGAGLMFTILPHEILDDLLDDGEV